MTYTMTFDASHKVGRGGGHVQGFMRHIARDADIRSGFQFVHANKNIDPARTPLNFTRVNNGAGGFRRLESVDGEPPSKELENYLNSRLATVSRTLRKDAVVMRGIILQLDPRWFAEHNSDWRTDSLNAEARRFIEESLDWACDEFEHRNIVGFSVHLDEYNPQIQVMMTPITKDGRLSQKDFFKGPADFMRQHKELRERMRAIGYDVEHRVSERSTEHLSSSEFQAKSDRMRDEAEAIQQERASLDGIVASVRRRTAELDSREQTVADREREAAETRAAAAQEREEARRAQDLARASHAEARRAEDAAVLERERLEAEVQRLEKVPADIERFLDRKNKTSGQTIRPIFEQFRKESEAIRSRAQRMVTGGTVDDSGPLTKDRDVGD